MGGPREAGWEGVHEAAADRRSGAAEIARRAAEALAAVPRGDIEEAVLTLVDGHPSMASLWRLGSDVLEASDHVAAARSFVARLDAEGDRVADGAARLLDAPVLTHSYSSTVVTAIARARTPALCARSEPGGEGTMMAEAIRSRGVPADVTDDDVAVRAASERIVVVGADAVGPLGTVNKVGTRRLAEAARNAGRLCLTLTGSSKLLASDLPARGPFERTPLHLFAAFVTESGPQRPEEVASLLPSFRLHPALVSRLG